MVYTFLESVENFQIMLVIIFIALNTPFFSTIYRTQCDHKQDM